MLRVWNVSDSQNKEDLRLRKLGLDDLIQFSDTIMFILSLLKGVPRIFT